MNCDDFENIVDDLICSRSIGARKKEQALAHAQNYVRCAARLSNEKFLTTTLAITRKAETAKAPAHVKANLLAAFAANSKASITITAPVKSSNRFAWLFAWQWAAAAAAIVIALISIATMRSMFMRPNDKLQQAANASSNDITIPKDKSEPENRVQSPRTPIAIKNTTNEQVARRNNDMKAAPRKLVKPSIEGASNNEVTSDFIALTYTNETSAIDNGMIVRVKVPRATLIAMGLPLNAANSDGYVKADVVVGDDGVARAIRLVQDSSSTGETKQKSN
jgi:hypothetical protein